MTDFKKLREKHRKFERARKPISRRAAWDLYEQEEDQMVKETYDEDIEAIDKIWKEIIDRIRRS